MVENRSDDPIWVKDGSPYLLGECKNCHRHTGKLTTKYGRATTGLFVAASGFTEAFHAQRAANRTSATNALVVPVDAADLDRWVTSDDKLGVLTDLYKRAVFEQSR